MRTPAQLEGLDGLVLPGGESTTHLLLVEPLAVYVEQMYEDGDLSILGI